MNCPCCESAHVSIFKKNIVQGYDLIHCDQCKVIFASPFRSPSSEFYTQASDVSSKERHTKKFELPKSHPARRCSTFKEIPHGSLLDVGCGNGSFASYASSLGLTVQGIDIDEQSLEIAKDRKLQNATFKTGTLGELVLDKENLGKYDYVTLFEVFEHLDNPLEAISNIYSVLKDKSYFIGSLPNIKRPLMWQMNMNYEVPPYHLTYWTIEAWKNFLKHNGFELIEAKPNVYFGYISDMVYFKSPRTFLDTPVRLFTALTKKVIESPLESALNLGASFFFVAKKI